MRLCLPDASRVTAAARKRCSNKNRIATLENFRKCFYKISVPPVADVEEIRVLEWHGEPGHQFSAGDLVVELETHKAIVEVRAGQDGVLRKILSNAGKWQQIGLPLADSWAMAALKPCRKI